jgi:hypothetical protein
MGLSDMRFSSLQPVPLLRRLGQCGSAVLASQRQDFLGPIRLLHARPFLSHMPGLAARFGRPVCAALLPRRAAAALCSRQAIGGRGLGRISGISLAGSQLPFQIGDLLRGVGDLLIPFRYLLTEFINLTLLPLDLPLQIFPTWRRCVRMTTRPCLLAVCAPSGSRIHQPYVKLFRDDCPAKSVRILELPQKQGREQMQGQITSDSGGERFCDGPAL